MQEVMNLVFFESTMTHTKANVRESAEVATFLSQNPFCLDL